jgi:hypothetical protein
MRIAACVGPSRLLVTVSYLGLLLAGAHLLAQDPNPQNGTDDRPHLQHQTGSVADYGLPDDAAVPEKTAANGPLVIPGLHLPATGRLWALDKFAGKQELVHLQYEQIDLKNHSGSNFLKAQAAPFFYKPKKTLEIKGSAARIRLHDNSPTFFVRRISGDGEESQNASQSSYDPNALSLIRLQVQSDRRVVAAIAFTQITGKASRSDSAIGVVGEQIPGTNWYMLRPNQPIPPGEYGLMVLPQAQNEFATIIYDFAIDPKAAENTGAIATDPEK